MNDIIRIGIVSTVSPSDRTVRVQFPSDDMVSGWLKVIKSPPLVTAAGKAGNKEIIADNNGIEICRDTSIDVDIKTEVSPWLPAVGETVLCIYNPGFNEDGFVIGGL